MIRIEVTPEVQTKTVTVRATGKSMDIREQVCFAHIPAHDGTAPRYPQRFVLAVRRDAQPLAAGDYTIAPDSLYVGDFAQLMLAPRLTPIAPRQVKAA